MRTVMVRYKTLEARAEENAALVRAVFDQLRARAPAGLRYATYRLSDGVTFVHLATVDADGPHPLTSQPAFGAFQAELKARCVEPPVVTELEPLDAYGYGPLPRGAAE